MKRCRREEREEKEEKEEEVEDGLGRSGEKRRRRSHLEEEEMMRGKRSRQERRLKEEEEEGRLSRSSPEMGPVRSSRREKERDSEFSGSEDDAMRPRDFVRMGNKERGGIERVGERQRIGEDKDRRERFRNILTEIFLALSCNIFSNLSLFCLILFPFSTFHYCRHETLDERLERMQREENEKEVKFLSSSDL